MWITGALLLPALITFIYYLSTNKRYRWIYILGKTFSRDITALVRFSKILYCLLYWTKNGISIPKALQHVAKKHPKKVALYFEDEQWTYEEIENFSNKVANYFSTRGVQKGDCVALLLENRLEYVGIFLGLSKLGVVTSFVNTNLVADSLAHCVNVVNSKILIYGSDFQKVVSEVKFKLEDTKLYEFKTKNLEPLIDAIDLKLGISEQSTTPPEQEKNVKPEDKALYIFTSGTTGLPKAAVITHLRYMYTASAFFYMLKLSPNDVLYCPLPLYHGVGAMLGIGQSLIFGMSVAIRRKFSASGYWTDCVKYNCTVGQYVGELCRYLLVAHKPGTVVDHPVKKLCGNGLRPELWKQFKETFKVEHIYEFYGSTEGNVNLVNMDGTVGSVGFIPPHLSKLYPGVLVKCNEDTGEPIRNADGFLIRCKPGEPGLLIGKIRKKTVINDFLGYADKKESQKKMFHDVFEKGDTYFNTGDTFVQDELGYFYFRDRTGDTFRWKGENVATSEVEATMSKILGLHEIIVYGVQIPGTEGRAGMAAIVDHDKTIDIDSLGKFMKSHLPAYAIPFFIRILDSVSLTGTFKFRKIELKKEGYDVNVVKDKLYFFDVKQATYVPLTSQLYDDIVNCRLRL